MKRPFVFSAVVAAITMAALVASPVVAHATAAPKATGDVALSGPLQYASFAAFVPSSGTASYTNFTYPDPGTNVWNISGTHAFVFAGTYAQFWYTIPPTAPAGLAGLIIEVSVTDNGSPGVGHDTYAHGVASASCTAASTSPYSITSGNVVVH